MWWSLLIATATASAGPPGMVLIPAGTFVMGREFGPHADEKPPHRVRLDAFWLDETLVTVADFRGFVERTRYVTSAERLGFGMTATVGMKNWAWEKKPGANWRAPWGADRAAEIPLGDDLPVTMVSHHDARAYCAERGWRLPTEAEWEYAMRAGREGTRYPWGDSPERTPGRLALNFWQGASHRKNLRRDGHVYVSPVRAFPPNAWGIYDPVGNLWQWTADWYAKDTYRTLAREAGSGEILDPRGPAHGEKRVVRGGSWWCGACTCEGNGLFYRGKSTPDSVFNNIGFRCVRDR